MITGSHGNNVMIYSSLRLLEIMKLPVKLVDVCIAVVNNNMCSLSMSDLIVPKCSRSKCE